MYSQLQDYGLFLQCEMLINKLRNDGKSAFTAKL